MVIDISISQEEEKQAYWCRELEVAENYKRSCTNAKAIDVLIKWKGGKLDVPHF